MKRTIGLILLAAATLLGLAIPSPGPAAPAGYTVTEVGTLHRRSLKPGVQDPDPSPFANLNHTGEVVGQAASDQILSWRSVGSQGAPVRHRTYLLHAYRWSPSTPNGTTGQITDLGTLRGHNESGAGSINDAGQIAGSSWLRGEDGNVVASSVRPVLFSQNKRIELGLLPGCEGGYATALNATGQVTGVCYGSQGTCAFRWENGTLSELGSFGGRDTFVYSLNSAGQAAGYSTDASGAPHAFRTAPNQPINPATDDLGHLGGGWAVAISINEAGDVVGVSGAADGTPHAFLFRAGVMTDMGLSEQGEAVGINDLGQVTGTRFEGSSLFLWEAGTVTDLIPLVPADPNRRLDFAHHINNAGQIQCPGRRRVAGTEQWRRTTFLLTPQ